jgi:hypothetical protein
MALTPPGIKRRSGGPANRQLRLRANAGAITDQLPLVHVTAVGIAREIVRSRKLEVRLCSVFNRKLLYFFAVRAAYRLKDGDSKSHQINRFPFVFILKPTAISAPFHVYPLDTGGAARGVFDEQADPYVFLEDYELPPTMVAAAGHIAWAFGTLDAYLDGDLRPDILNDVPTHETVTRGFIDIARLARSGSNQPDKRASAVEIAVSHDVDLKDNVLLAIIPKQYLEVSGSSPNHDFIGALQADGIPWDVYDWQPNTMPNEFQDEIGKIARRFFKKQGLLG